MSDHNSQMSSRQLHRANRGDIGICVKRVGDMTSFKMMRVLLLGCLLVQAAECENASSLVPTTASPNPATSTTLASSPEMPQTTELSQAFAAAEREVVTLVNGVLRSLLPQLVGGAGDAQLSRPCTAAMMKVFANVKRLRGWTLKLLDSLGRPSSGVLSGSGYSAGDFSACLDLSVSAKGESIANSSQAMFRGQHCRVRISMPDAVVRTAAAVRDGILNATDLRRLREVVEVAPFVALAPRLYLSHLVGLCVPSTCSTQDIQQLVELIPFPGTKTVERCETREDLAVDHTQLVIACIFILLLVVVCASSCVDWLTHRTTNEKVYHGRCWRVCSCFSAGGSLRRLVAGDSILRGQSMQGVFVCSVLWLVVGTTYLYPNDLFFARHGSLDNLRQYWDTLSFSLVVNYPLAYDALFVCYGFLLTFPLWHSSSKAQGVNVRFLPMILKDCVRLLVPLATFLGAVCMLPLLGSGPLFSDLVGDSVRMCRSNAGPYLAFTANTLPSNEQCFTHLWFISCLAQLMVIGMLMCWILSKSLKVGALLTIVLTIALDGTVAILTFNDHLPPAYNAYFVREWSEYWWRVNLSLPLSHWGPYAAGMLAGILVARRDTQRSYSKCVGMVCWLACLATLAAILLAPFYARTEPMGRLAATMYAGLHRTAFGACVAWLLVAGPFKMAGCLGWLLSSHVWDPLFRLGLLALLCSGSLVAFTTALSTQQIPYSHFSLMQRSISHGVLSFACALLLALLLDLPLRQLRHLLCPSSSSTLPITVLDSGAPKERPTPEKGQLQCKTWTVTEPVTRY